MVIIKLKKKKKSLLQPDILRREKESHIILVNLFHHGYVLSIKGVIGTNITIKVLCGVMGDASLGEPYARYAAVARLMMDTFSMKCLDANFSTYLRDMTNTSWDGPAAGGGGYENVLGSGVFMCVNMVILVPSILKCHLNNCYFYIRGIFLVRFVGGLSGGEFLFSRQIIVDIDIVMSLSSHSTITHEQSTAAATETPVSPSSAASGGPNITQTGYVLRMGCGHSQHVENPFLGVVERLFLGIVK